MLLGQQTHIHYQNHYEAVIVFQGKGEIEVLEDGQELGQGNVYPLYPGCAYALDQHDRHYVRVHPEEDLHVAW